MSADEEARRARAAARATLPIRRVALAEEESPSVAHLTISERIAMLCGPSRSTRGRRVVARCPSTTARTCLGASFAGGIVVAELNDDFVDMLLALDAEKVEFLVVGAHALAAHGIVRATGDLDVLVRASPDNARRVLRALVAFGAPVDAHGVTTADFAQPDRVYRARRDDPQQASRCSPEGSARRRDARARRRPTSRGTRAGRPVRPAAWLQPGVQKPHVLGMVSDLRGARGEVYRPTTQCNAPVTSSAGVANLTP